MGGYSTLWKIKEAGQEPNRLVRLLTWPVSYDECADITPLAVPVVEAELGLKAV